MGWFSKPKDEQGSNTQNKLNWIPLKSIDQLMDIVKTTHDKPILLFKHSTRCSISAMAKSSLERNWSTGADLCDTYLLDLLAHRDVSDKISEITGLRHESPQAIVLKGDEIIYDDSHSGIDARRIESILVKK